MLSQGASDMGVNLSDSETGQLMSYLSMLIKWNKAYNLTAIRDPEKMISLHLLDSLIVHRHLSGQRVLDVGTGPGLPGIVLAIMNPEHQFTLLDSNGKKTRFLFQVVTSLGLKNVTIVNDRVEAFRPDSPFDTITSRAFASLLDMVNWCHHLLSAEGEFLAMKGQYPKQEIDDLPPGFKVLNSTPLFVPGVDGDRHLLRIHQLRPSSGSQGLEAPL
ncbi:MAG: 16S rRNA (guanine(527)-N(7))-methyltransferase RsmG [Oceanobacter sp.]